MGGKESRELHVISDSEFEIDEAEIYASPVEDAECAVEIWNGEKGWQKNSCITGWKGSRESQVIIDGKLYPRQEGCLFWLPVKEAGAGYLETKLHTVSCSEGKVKGEKKYRVNPADETHELLEKLKEEPLVLSIDMPYGNLYTQSERIKLSGRYGNGYGVSVYAGGSEAESGKGRYSAEVSLSEGENLIRIEAQDKTGRSAEKTVRIYKDSTKPEIRIIRPQEGECINLRKVEFETEGNEEGLWWQFNDGEWESGNGKVKYRDFYPEDGFYTYRVRAQDRSGNVSDEKSVSFCKDESGPEGFEIKLNVSGWTNNTQPEAVFRASDAVSGTDHYEYRIDEGEWKVCESPLRLERLEDGRRILSIRAYDRAGNFCEETAEIYIDTSNPPVPGRARPVAGEKQNVIKWIGEDDNSIADGKIVEKEGGRSYRIERSPAWEGGTMLLENYGYGELRFEDREVKEGSEYAYRMWSVDRAGNESEKTGWKSVVTGLASSQIEKDGQTVIEYDGMTVTLPEGAVGEDIISIQIQKLQDKDIEEQPVEVSIGSFYMISAVRQKGEETYVTEHADLKKPAVIEVSYNPSLLPEGYTESDAAAFYYDDIWGMWLQMPETYINTKEHTVLFRTEHFSEFNVQATKKAVLSEAQLREGAYKLKSEKTGPSEVRVSGEDGGVSYEFTEYIMPGKADMSLPVQRVYSTAKAYEDTSMLADKETTKKIKIDGEGVWSIAWGWKINMPYMKVNADTIVIYGTQGQCFTTGQAKPAPFEPEPDKNQKDYDTVMFLECHEYSDTIAELHFKSYEKQNYFLFFKTSTSTRYNFKGAVLHQSDGKKIHYDENGRVTSIRDCSGTNWIKFSYKASYIEVTDTLGNSIKFHKTSDLISRIEIQTDKDTKNIKYEKPLAQISGIEIPLDILTKATDLAGRTWTYGYEVQKLKTSSVLEDPPSGYAQSSAKEYSVPALSSIEGKGSGFTKIKYSIQTGLTYVDTVTSDSKSYTFIIEQDKFYAVKKTEGLSSDLPLRTTKYTIRYAGPLEKQFYVAQSSADDGNLKTVTEYEAVTKGRFRLSNAPEAIQSIFLNVTPGQNNKTGEQEKDTKQVLTYAKTIKTYTKDETLIQSVTNEINRYLMRLTKVTTDKGSKNYVTDEYTYITSSGNMSEESHVYETAGHKSSVVIKREYSEPVNYRTNLVTKMTKISSGFVEEEESSNTVTESYGYDSSGLLVTKTTAKGSWNYRYENGELKEVLSPENRLTQYSYEYPDPKTSDVYTITTTRTAAEGSSFDTDETITEKKEYDRKTGSLKKETDADGYVSEYDYDELGRLTLSKKNGGKAVVTVIYDDENLKTKVTDELGCVTINQFDNLGRLLKVSKTAEDKNITVLLEYDGYDRVIKMSEPSYEDILDISKAAHADYEYDSLGRITRFTDADNHITEYSYIDSLNMTQMDRGGLEKTRVYKDNPGNIIKKENWIKDSEWVTGESWFDGEGKTLCTEDAEGNRTLTGYNSLGLVQTITCPDSLVETRMYDADGILPSCFVSV